MPINMKSAQHTNEDEAAKLVAGPDPDAKPKPKRPLSAFNLFYRFKRQKVLKALAAGADASDKDTICELITAVPGLEHYLPTTSASKIASPDVLEPLRRNTIRKELEQNLEPRDTKTRAHRKNKGAMNGSMSFVEMGKIMNTSWKNCDPFAKSVFNELAEEGRARYRHRIEAYNKAESKRKYIAPFKKGKKVPAKTKSKLPSKKMAIATASPLSSGSGEEDAHDYGTAEAMVQLATRPAPLKPNDTNNDDCAAAPSLPHLPSKTNDIVGNKEARIVPKEILQTKADGNDSGVETEAKIVPKHILRAKSHTNLPFNSSHQILPPLCAPPTNYSTAEVMVQLATRTAPSNTNSDNSAAAPSLPQSPSKVDEVDKEPKIEPKDILRAVTHNNSPIISSHEIPTQQNLTTKPPTVGDKANTMPTVTSHLELPSTVAPSILRPPAVKADDTDNEARIVPKDILRAKSNNITSFNSSTRFQTMPPGAPSNYSSTEQMLMLRVRELERQLEEERLRSRIRELEFERSQQKAREDLLRYVYDDVSTQNNRTMSHAFSSNYRSMSNESRSRFCTSAMSPSMQAAERADILARIEELQHRVAFTSSRPFSNISGGISANLDERPIKRQMMDSYFAARRG